MTFTVDKPDDRLEWLDARNQLARRAARAGRTVAEQTAYEGEGRDG